MTINVYNMSAVTPEMHQKLTNIQTDLEQSFIIMIFKFSSPSGPYKNEIIDIPFIARLTIHPERDKILIDTIRQGISDLGKLLAKKPEDITLKRVAAIRQRYFVLMHRNQNPNNARRQNWNKKSAKWLAGLYLLGTFEKYLNWADLHQH